MSIFPWRNKPLLEERHTGALAMMTAAQNALVQGGAAVPASLAAVFRSIQMLSDMVSQLPIDAIDPQTGFRLADTPAVLLKPDPSKTRHDFLNEVMSSLLYRGNAYLYVPALDRTGNALAFIVIPPDEVSVTQSANRRGARYVWTQRSVDLVPGSNFIHIRLQARPGALVGLGPIEAARLSLSGYSDLEAYGREYFSDSANPTGVLSSAAAIDKEESDLLKAQWQEAHQGKRDVAVLGGGLDFKPLSFSPEDSQFLQTREYQVSDVARWFGIPGPLLGASSGDSLTYATTESVVRWLLVTCIAPTYLERIEQSLSTMLPRTQEASFDTRALLRADTQQRFAAFQTAIEAGFMTPNEVRELERLEPMEGGDELGFKPRGDVAQGFSETGESGSADLEATSL